MHFMRQTILRAPPAMGDYNREQDGPAKPDPSAIMEPIAHSLTQQQIKAVAVYLNHLE
jgi:cytochrome c553